MPSINYSSSLQSQSQLSLSHQTLVLHHGRCSRPLPDPLTVDHQHHLALPSPRHHLAIPLIPISNPKTGDVFGDLFSPSSKKESTNKKQGYGGQSYNCHNIATADGKFHSSPKKSQSIPQKGGNAAEHCEISEPCLMSSSVDYGCRDNYPYDPDNRYPGPSSYLEKKDRKDGSDYANPEI